MPNYAKDVVLAVLGASVGLAGLLLVFSGFVFGQASAASTVVPDKKIARYKSVGRAGLYPFLGAIGNSLAAILWTVLANCADLFRSSCAVRTPVAGNCRVWGIYHFALLVSACRHRHR